MNAPCAAVVTFRQPLREVSPFIVNTLDAASSPRYVLRDGDYFDTPFSMPRFNIDFRHAAADISPMFDVAFTPRHAARCHYMPPALDASSLR